jgi:8-oxo-dGTP diphosphatase
MSASSPPDPKENDDEVRAAGGVLWRQDHAGRLEILLVHRPRYDDWSLPKGKCEPGESDEDCSAREVLEETGIRAELEDPLPEVRYRDSKGRPKVVRYWRMRPVETPDRFVPNHEVDEIAWLTLPEAIGLLTYDHDRELVSALRV